MYKTIRTILALGLALPVTGCGTLFSGTSERMSFTAEPKDATIYLNDRLIGQGAASVDVSRALLHGAPTLRVESPGYQTQKFRLQTKFNTVSLLNLTSGPSWTTDFATGAMFEYAPNQYHIQLIRSDRAVLELRQRVTHLVMVNADSLRRELAVGDGEILETLKALVSAGDDALRDQVRDTLLTERQALIAAPGALELAEAVTRLIAEPPQTASR